MNRRTECILYTEDEDLATRWSRLLASVCVPRAAATPAQLDRAVGSLGGAVVLLDVRAESAFDQIEALKRRALPVSVIAIGAPRSEPVVEARGQGVFATLAPDEDWRKILNQVVQALDRVELEIEVRALRTDARAPEPRPAPAPPPRGFSLDLFAGALRHLNDVDHLLQHVVEGIAQTAGVSRAGLFARAGGSNEEFCLRADRSCLAEARQARFPPDHPLVQWMERNAHVVCRQGLDRIGAPSDRPALARALDLMGAEAMIPLFARGRIIGWFFVGHRADGTPFEGTDFEQLSSMAAHVAMAMDNALLYEELSLQKRFADTLLQGLPVGLIGVDATGIIRGFNRAAERILSQPGEPLIGQPVERMGGRAADLLRGALAKDLAPEPVEWDLPGENRRLAGSVFRLDPDQKAGALLLIEDITEKKRLAERAEQLDRSAFWTELASAMAHEIRNPLVVVQTFAQLLPERYQDEEFRRDFSREVPPEVARLAAIADQIGELARPHTMEHGKLDLSRVLTDAVETARSRVAGTKATIEAKILESVPAVEGDTASIVEALAHLIANALESIPDSRAGLVRVVASREAGSAVPPRLSIAVEDNGRGIAEELSERIFSPFCTSKARGMGLGLPIARRVALDHNGDLRMESLREGTRATLLLPALP